MKIQADVDMACRSDEHRRRSIRLPGYDYAQTGAYFITICTRNMGCLFGNIENGQMHANDAGHIAHQCWQDIPAHFPQVVCDTFVIMPNHVHGIVFIIDSVGANAIGVNVGTDDVGRVVGAKDFSPLRCQRPPGTSKTIGSIVRGFKIGVTKWMRRHTTVQDVWQRNYYEHIIRNDDELHLIRQYILDNPAKWDLDRNNPNAVQPAATNDKDVAWERMMG